MEVDVDIDVDILAVYRGASKKVSSGTFEWYRSSSGYGIDFDNSERTLPEKLLSGALVAKGCKKLRRFRVRSDAVHKCRRSGVPVYTHL